MLGLLGCITRAETARFAMKSLTGCQEVPPLVVLQIPPETLPTHIWFGFVGWITIERIRPPILPGPSQVQSPGDTPAASTLGSSLDCIIWICSAALLSP